jgi:hypothetical protein
VFPSSRSSKPRTTTRLLPTNMPIKPTIQSCFVYVAQPIKIHMVSHGMYQLRFHVVPTQCLASENGLLALWSETWWLHQSRGNHDSMHSSLSKPPRKLYNMTGTKSWDVKYMECCIYFNVVGLLRISMKSLSNSN